MFKSRRKTYRFFKQHFKITYVIFSLVRCISPRLDLSYIAFELVILLKFIKAGNSLLLASSVMLIFGQFSVLKVHKFPNYLLGYLVLHLYLFIYFI